MKGHKEPLMKISKKLARNYDLICFDEFHVQDIAHAMIFESLFRYLNEFNVSFVITSIFIRMIYTRMVYKEKLLFLRFCCLKQY